MKKVVITAANSFLGRRLCKIFSMNGFFVYAIVRKEFQKEEMFRFLKGRKIIKCDMKEYGQISEMVHDTCDIGFLLAWDGTREPERSDKRKQESSCIYSLDCLRSFIKLGCSTIFTSGSQAEYGPQQSLEKVTETSKEDPNTAYGRAKLELYRKAEIICKAASVRLIEPRYFSLYGPDDSEKTMLINTIRAMLLNHPCVFTQGIQLWDFLHVDDAVEAVFRLAVSSAAEGIYNFGFGKSRPLKEYIEEIKIMTNTKSKIRYGEIDYPATGIVHTNPSVEKLKSAAGWMPEIPFSDGIREVIEVQKEYLMG